MNENDKKCPRCEATKPLDEFSKHSAKYDGRQTYCKPCSVQIVRTSQKKHLRQYYEYQRKYKKTHPVLGHPLYMVWHGMKQRCFNSNNPAFANYGGRGITVCERWLESFDAFIADMGDRPEGKSPKGRALYSIDRIDNDGNYTPENCRWADSKTQNANRRKVARNG